MPICTSQAWEADGNTFLAFTRKWDVGNDEYYTIEKDFYTRIIWAIGGSNKDKIVEHSENSNRGGSINFWTGETKTEVVLIPWQVAHGTMMVLAWAVLIPWGSILARYYKNYDPWWFKMHRGIQSCAVLVIVVAFILAIVKEPELNAHGVVGIVATSLCVVQPINALLRPDKGRSFRTTWENVHRYGGRIALIVGLINLFIGLVVIEAHIGMPIALGVWLFLGLGYTLYRERILRTIPSPDAHHFQPVLAKDTHVELSPA